MVRLPDNGNTGFTGCVKVDLIIVHYICIYIQFTRTNSHSLDPTLDTPAEDTLSGRSKLIPTLRTA